MLCTTTGVRVVRVVRWRWRWDDGQIPRSKITDGVLRVVSVAPF